MLSHINLGNYYQMIWNLAQHHKYSITELENMLPYERDLYFSMLTNYIQKQNEKNGIA